MSEVQALEPVEVEEKRDTVGCLDSWVLRITFVLFLILAFVVLVAFVTYMDTKADRSEPIEILHYPGFTLMSEESTLPGQSRLQYRAVFDNMSPTLLTDIEAHYQRQMDKCFRLSEDVSDPSVFHTVVCEKDRSHDWLGFTQFARVEIRLIRDEDYNWTGEAVLIVDNQWES